jgi:hypothetical protein
VAVEKLHFRQNSENLGDPKCPGKPRTSFVGLPIAKFFQPVFVERGDFTHDPRAVGEVKWAFAKRSIFHRQTIAPADFKIRNRPGPGENSTRKCLEDIQVDGFSAPDSERSIAKTGQFPRISEGKRRDFSARKTEW